MSGSVLHLLFVSLSVSVVAAQTSDWLESIFFGYENSNTAGFTLLQDILVNSTVYMPQSLEPNGRTSVFFNITLRPAISGAVEYESYTLNPFLVNQ